MVEEVRVVKIADGNDPVLDVVSKWIYDWYGEESGRNEIEVREFYRNSACTDRVPQTFVAFKGSEPVGTFQFGMSDNFVRPDVYPWLKNVYIEPSFRGNGYSHAMLEAAVANAREIGLKELYLFTHMTGFYEKYGWQFIEEFETYNEEYGKQRLYVLKF